ncbi:MAG: TlyA family rRNA (cytidine-2'-O)-methyltransferase, partial [Mesorhizobium sp.]
MKPDQPATSARQRLDDLLVARGLFASRSRAA